MPETALQKSIMLQKETASNN